MTVRRKSQEIIHSSRSHIAESIRNILNQNPPYKQTKELQFEKEFIVKAKPSWWITSTSMKISLEDVGFDTCVTAETISQWYVWGDVFDCYQRYINEFLMELKKQAIVANQK